MIACSLTNANMPAFTCSTLWGHVKRRCVAYQALKPCCSAVLPRSGGPMAATQGSCSLMPSSQASSQRHASSSSYAALPAAGSHGIGVALGRHEWPFPDASTASCWAAYIGRVGWQFAQPPVRVS